VRYGRYAKYYENGQIKIEGNYNIGQRDGKRISYNEDGSIKKVENYKDGELVK
jgi:antitoxin component YwqK of YwqJK toxin-antitoxin module